MIIKSDIIKKCKEDPIEFFKTLGAFEYRITNIVNDIREYQSYILKNINSGKDLFISKPRFIGMTYCLTAFSFWKAIFHPHIKIALINTNNKIFFNSGTICHLFKVNNNPDIRLLQNYFKIINLNKIEFANGSLINFYSSEDELFQLHKYDVIICDEFDYFYDIEDFYEKILNLCNKAKCQIIISSTPNPSTKSDTFIKNVLDYNSESHTSIRVLYNQSRYTRNCLNWRFPLKLSEAGLFHNEGDIRDLIYRNWFPAENLISKTNFIFY